jgi:hypothetical protein
MDTTGSSRKFSPGLIVLAAILTLSRAATAQVLYGSFTGNVRDSSGGAVANAKVEALNVATGISKQVLCDERGVYLFNDLQPGAYRLTISAPSFATFVTENIRLDGNTVQRLDAQMQVAQMNQSVTVDASAVTLKTERADVSAQIAETQVDNLPLGANRNFQTLFKLVPGSSPPAPSHSSAGNPTGALQSYVNGGADTSNSTRIDGTAVLNFWEGNIIAYVPPAEAIEAVNIVTASFDAEQGQAGGSVVNVAIKSGTNTFHGSAWEYNTNSDLKARNFFYYGTNNPKNILNQFGASLGGPIKKNKLFFFADWERYMLRQSVSGLQSVPSDPVLLANWDLADTVGVAHFPSIPPDRGVIGLVASTLSLFRTRAALQLEIIALRHQLGVLQRSVKKPKLNRFDRCLWAWLCGAWAEWRSALRIVKPANRHRVAPQRIPTALDLESPPRPNRPPAGVEGNP